MKNTVWYTIPLMLSAAARFHPLPAAEYRVDSQDRFDELREATFRPGDAILFKKAARFAGMFAPAGSGTAAAPITLSTYGTGPKPVIDAQGKHTAGLLLKNVAYWEVAGLAITNTDGTDADQGTLFGIYVLAEDTGRTVRHIHIDNCHVHDVNGAVAGKRRGGIHVHVTGNKPARFHDLRITGNRIERIGGVGIGNASSRSGVAFRAKDTVARNLWTKVYVAGNVVDRTGRNNIIARVSKDAVYEYNVLANSSRHSTGHSIFCFDTDGIRIQHNEAYGNVGAGGKDRGGFDADYSCTRTFIQYNYSHDNLWFCGIMKKRNRGVVIRYNLSVNDREGIYFYGFEKERKARDIHIYNNTHYVRKGLDAAVFCEKRTPLNTLFENNIFYFAEKGTWGKHAKGINTRFRNNVYVNIRPHPADPDPVTADPRLVSPGAAKENIDMKTKEALRGYLLGAGSRCRGAGRIVPDNGGRDLLGSPLPPGRPDPGALQQKAPAG